ncbi:MAG: DUF3047 domain-containing protein [bacterium]|nr:DUF3047 domain-containing protein [bacterium]
MKLYLLIAVILLLFPWTGSSETLLVAEFESGDLSGWEVKEFKGKTDYSVAYVEARKVLHAKSSASASAMLKRIEVDLEKTPWLNWTWRIDDTLGPLNELSKEGDDYPARVYVVISGGLFFWKTRALNYVWSNNQPVGNSWPNAYTSNAVMLALQSGRKNRGKWIFEKRNVRDDLRKLLGEDYGRIDAVAIMTDTDNGGGEASAYYGDMYFTSE